MQFNSSILVLGAGDLGWQCFGGWLYSGVAS
jgi:hypothetical protein